MKTEDIINGVREASCEAELTAHLDLLELAIDKGACDFNAREWLDIACEIESRNNDFKGRVVH